MAWTPQLPCVVLAGSHIAQVIFFLAGPLSASPIIEQREGGFGSTEVSKIFWTQCITFQCPTYQCKGTLKGRHIILQVLIDTGTDVTVISKSQWLGDWPLTTVSQVLPGMGRNTQSLKSQHLVQITRPEGQIATVKPFVSVPLILWARDVLTQWGNFYAFKFSIGIIGTFNTPTMVPG